MCITSQISQMILQNSLKYKGLNTKAKEFVPDTESNNKITLEHIFKKAKGSQIEIESIQKETEDDFFDRLEKEFQYRNAWIFE